MDQWLLTLFFLLTIFQFNNGGGTGREDLTYQCMHERYLNYLVDFPSAVFNSAILVTFKEKTIHRTSNYDSSCTVIFKLPKLSKSTALSLSVEKINTIDNSCSHDPRNYITLHDGSGTYKFGSFCGNYDSDKHPKDVRKFFSDSGYFEMRFKKFPAHYSIRFVVTALTGPVTSDKCKNEYYGVSCCKSCETSFCTSQDLKCDGNYNCDAENNADEENCGIRLSKVTIILAGVSCLIVILIIACVIAKCCRNRKKRRDNRGSGTNIRNMSTIALSHAGYQSGMTFEGTRSGVGADTRGARRDNAGGTAPVPSAPPIHSVLPPEDPPPPFFIEPPPSYNEAMTSTSQTPLYHSGYGKYS